MKQDKRLLKLAGLLNENLDLGEEENHSDSGCEYCDGEGCEHCEGEETEIGQHELEDLGVTPLDDPNAKYGKFGDEIFGDTETQRSSWDPSKKSWNKSIGYNESVNKITESKKRNIIREEIKKLLSK